MKLPFCNYTDSAKRETYTLISLRQLILDQWTDTEVSSNKFRYYSPLENSTH